MSMTREDMLRELELLPVWTLNPDFVAHQAPAQIDATTPAQLEAIQLDVIQPIAEVAVENSPADTTPAQTIAQETVVEKIAVQWLLYCPLEASKDLDALTLLQNMVRAMQLVSADYQLVHEAQLINQFQPERTLIFGQAAAKALLGMDVVLEDVAQAPYEHMQRPCWVVHHPKVLLENPALKRAAWQIMCAAKTYMQQTNATT